jgi:hypothetical protein
MAVAAIIRLHATVRGPLNAMHVLSHLFIFVT